MSYAINRLRARTENNQPTMTDQSQAKETDINVIVGNMLKMQAEPMHPTPDMGGDYSEFPTDLRGMIEAARSMEKHRRQLPKELRNKPVAELLAMTQEQLAHILAPPEEPKQETK